MSGYREIQSEPSDEDLASFKSTVSQEDIDQLVDAIHFTVEYVGYSTLPPIEGWSWFDAIKRHNPELAAYHVEQYQKGYNLG